MPGIGDNVIIAAGATVNLGAAANIVNLNINSGGTLNIDAIQSLTIGLSGNLINNGTFNAGVGTVSLTSSSAQTISGTTASTFNNLTINSSVGVTGSTAMTVNGVLNLQSDNPTRAKGTLAMSSGIILNLAINATIIGIGDISGIVKRTHIFTPNKFYAFSNTNSGFIFEAVTGQTLPTSISIKTTIGSDPDDSNPPQPEDTPTYPDNMVKRFYDISQTGGSGTYALFRGHYKDSEIISGVTESLLNIWKLTGSTSFQSTEYERSNINTTDNFITIQDINFAVIPGILGTYKYGIGPSTTSYYTWAGVTSMNWETSTNWSPEGIPSSNDAVIIPSTLTTTYAPSLPGTTTCKSIYIQSNGVLNAIGGATLTLAGKGNVWNIESGGIFNANNSTIIFGNASEAASISGTTSFYNVTIASGAQLKPAFNCYMTIAGTLTLAGTGILSAVINENSIEFNGTSQAILNPNGRTPGYHSLILSGTNTKTLPSTIYIYGKFTNNTTGTVDFTTNSSTIIFSGKSSNGQTIDGTASTTFNNLTVDCTPYTLTVATPASVNGTLNVTSGSIVDMSINTLSGPITSISGTGTLKTQNTSSTPIPSNKTWTQSVVFNGTASQTVVPGTYAGLQISNTSATATASGTLNTNTLTIDNGAILDMGINPLNSVSTNSGTGTLKTQNTNSTPIPSNKTWTQSVVFNGTASQTVVPGTYAGLQISNTSATAIASGTLNPSTLTIDNGAVLDMGINLLNSMSTNNGTGTLKTASTLLRPIPCAKTWTGTVIFNGSSAQTLVTGTFNNLTLNNLSGVKLGTDSLTTVNGSFNINTGSKLDIEPGKQLTANTIVNNTGVDGLIIRSSSTGPTGSLIFHNNESSPVQATVEMYSKASWTETGGVKSNFKWQYFGLPIRSIISHPAFDGAYIRRWNEPTTKWIQQYNDSIIKSFLGYEICQYNGATYFLQGNLENRNFTTNLTIGASGLFLYGNPYTAAIEINKIVFGAAMDSTVYLYNTGSHDDWYSQGGVSGENPGQYLSIPLKTAGLAGLPGQIPSMQGFMIAYKDLVGDHSFSIPYSSVLKNTDRQRAPAINRAKASEQIYTIIDVKGTRYSDRMWLFTNPDCSHTFNNGWDGSKFSGSSLAPQLYAMEPDGIYQINSVDDINNTELGFTAGEDTNYTLTFSHNNLIAQYSTVYLLDLADNTTTDITESGSEYTFATEKNVSPEKRFRIVTNLGVTTDSKNLSNNDLKVFNSKQTIIVSNKSNHSGELMLYDVSGRYIQKYPFTANKLTTIPTNLSSGTYLVKILTNKEELTERIIIQQ